MNFVAEMASPVAMNIQEIKTATSKDPTLQTVIKALDTNTWPNDMKSSSFYKVRQELSVTADKKLLLRGTRMVIPESLQQQAIALAHEGHQGIVRSKQLLRTKVWFPGVDKLMEQCITECIACQANTIKKNSHELLMTDLPDYPWQRIDADFFGPLPTGEHLLVIIDQYSRYPVVEIVHSLTSRAIIPVFDKVFSEFGIPEQLKTDNGPPFNSADFAKFMKHLGVKLHRVTPLWPQANGEVERFMQSLGKLVRTAKVDGRSWKQALYTLLRNYRATPHATIGVPPANIMFGRELNVKIPAMQHTNVCPDIEKVDADRKVKMKLYADQKRRVSSAPKLNIGDKVLVRQKKRNKTTSPYNPNPLIVTKVDGTRITAQNSQLTITRNVSFFKPFRGPSPKLIAADPDDSDDEDIPLTQQPPRHVPDIPPEQAPLHVPDIPPAQPIIPVQHQPVPQPIPAPVRASGRI